MNLIVPVSVRQALARYTEPEHEALHVHPWISRLARPDLDPGTYAKIMAAYHAFFCGIDATRRKTGVFANFSPGPQIAAMESDMAALGCRAYPFSGVRRTWVEENRWGVLGALYVLHGSGFAAKTLNANVKKALPDAPRAYLSLGTSKDVWCSLISEIETSQSNRVEKDLLFEGAAQTFRAFGQWVNDVCEAG